MVIALVPRTLTTSPYNKSDKDARAFLASRMELLDRTVAEKTPQIGCGNTEVQALIRRYKFQADWQYRDVHAG